MPLVPLPDLAAHDPADTRLTALPEDLRPWLRDYLRLKDVQLRAAREPAEGHYLAEGVEVIRRALAAGHRPPSLLLSEQRAADLADVLPADAPVFVAPAEAFARLTGVDLHRGALASMHRPAPLSAADLLPGARRLVVLEDVVDHTNVGAVFRSAAALGGDGVLVSPRCADPLYRRSVRVSMGTALTLPWARADSWPGDLDVLRAAGFAVVALALTDDAVPLDDYEPGERVALLLGTEGDGLSRRAVAAADAVVRIPMAAGVDSLNVAAASAVAMWALR